MRDTAATGLHGTAYAPRAQVVHEQTRARGQAHHPTKRASGSAASPSHLCVHIVWSPIKFKNPPAFLSPSGRRASESPRLFRQHVRQPRAAATVVRVTRAVQLIGSMTHTVRCRAAPACSRREASLSRDLRRPPCTPWRAAHLSRRQQTHRPPRTRARPILL